MQMRCVRYDFTILSRSLGAFIVVIVAVVALGTLPASAVKAPAATVTRLMWRAWRRLVWLPYCFFVG